MIAICDAGNHALKRLRNSFKPVNAKWHHQLSMYAYMLVAQCKNVMTAKKLT